MLYVKFRIHVEKHCPVKHFAVLKNVCSGYDMISSNLLFFYELLLGPYSIFKFSLNLHIIELATTWNQQTELRYPESIRKLSGEYSSFSEN